MFTNPEKNLEDLGLEPGNFVADFGSGSGFYTIAASKIVGEDGKVFSIEVQKDLLEKLKNETDKENLSNVEFVWGDIEEHNGTRIADRCADVVFLTNTLFQLEDKNGCLEEVKRVLKPGGKVLLIDWSDSFGGLGPVSSAIVTKDKAKDMLETAGFTFDREFDPGAHHYALIYKKA